MANRQRDPAKEQHWRQLLQRWQTSGQSVHAFCRTHGLSRPLFYAWRGILAERDAAAAAPRINVPTPAAASPVFREIARRDQEPLSRTQSSAAAPPSSTTAVVPAFLPVTFDTSVSSAAALEVMVAGGRILRVRAGFDADVLRRLLAVLEAPPC